MMTGDITQEHFTALYDRLLKFALSKASRYFRDWVLREDAACEAVNLAVDAMCNDEGQLVYNEQTARRTIESSLRQASRHRELEPIEVKEEGFHGYQIKAK